MSKSAILHKLFLLNTYPYRGKVFAKGKGNYLVDESGERYLDLMTNYGVNAFGHANPRLTKVFREQIGRLTNLHGSFANEVRSEAARQLIKRSGGKLKKVYFSNSGAEANEAAIKFALVVSGRKKIIAMKNSFHGKTSLTALMTHSKKYQKGIKHLIKDIEFIKYGDASDLKKKINEETACVILEPVQGDGGINLPPKGYLKKVQQICIKRGVILIFDEIQSGAGRTGRFLASHEEDLSPDIVTLGKALAGGMPIGVTLVSNEVAGKIPKAFQTSTFGGNPLAARGVVEILNLLDEKRLKYINKIGNYFLSELQKIKSSNIKEVRGKGLMIGIEVKKDRDKVLKNLQLNKILACPASENVVRFLPPYTITKKEIDTVVNVLSSF